jgi:cyanophycinase
VRQTLWTTAAGLFFLLTAYTTIAQTSFRYRRIGNPAAVNTKTSAGLALLGGGPDFESAVRWMCEKSGHGDFLILGSRPSETDQVVAKVCNANSVAFLMIPDREAANDPFVTFTIEKADAIFIDGGQQKDYVNFWLGSRVQEALNNAATRGIPIAGSSAGLAILGEFSYAAFNGSADSRESLLDPYNARITLVDHFLSIPYLSETITDTHLIARDRTGRLVAFMARILEDGQAKDVRGIGVDENSAALVDSDGKVTVVGSGTGAYFFWPSERPKTCKAGAPLVFSKIRVYSVPNQGTFSLKDWEGTGGNGYFLSAAAGVIRMDPMNGESQ